MTVRPMATTTWTPGPAQSAATFDTLNPATAEVIGTFPVCGEAEVNTAVKQAQKAAVWWAGLSPQQRRQRLLA